MAHVSVIVPAYNASRFLAETLHSVLAQTYGDWEVVVVDDGSTDDTAAIAQSFTSDARVRYFRQANAGVSAARNAGLAATTGAYVAFLDADDVWLPDNLAHKVAALEARENASAVLVHSAVEHIDGRSTLLGVVNAGKAGHVLRDLLLWNGTVVPGPSSILVRRAAAEAIGGFDTALSTAADQDFFFRLAATGTFAQVPEVLCRYRLHDNNMHQNIALMERDHRLVYEKARQRNAFETPAFRRRCFAQLYLILAGSWWVNGGNKMRGLGFMLRAVLTYPPAIGQLFRKLR